MNDTLLRTRTLCAELDSAVWLELLEAVGAAQPLRQFRQLLHAAAESASSPPIGRADVPERPNTLRPI